jgi:hypothetical protein
MYQSEEQRKEQSKQQSGGQLVYYDKDTQHLNWIPLNIHTMDCGPNCFSLLRYATGDVCREMAIRTEYGIMTYKINNLLNEAYGPGHEWRPINHYNQYGNGERNNRSPNFELDDNGKPIEDGGHINTYLPKNHATLGFMETDEAGHYFVVLRQNGYYAIDAQSGQTQKLEDYIDAMVEYGFHQESFLLLTSPEPMKEPNQVTMEMVKRHFPYPKKTRRGSVKSLKKSRKKSRKNRQTNEPQHEPQHEQNDQKPIKNYSTQVRQNRRSQRSRRSRKSRKSQNKN